MKKIEQMISDNEQNAGWKQKVLKWKLEAEAWQKEA